jgi:hypothetical protein
MQVRQDEVLSKVRNIFESKPVESTKVPLRFVEYHSPIYRCEFAIKGKDIIFHFFPKKDYPRAFLANITAAFKGVVGEMASDKLDIEQIVEDAIEGGAVSIFVRARGFGENVVLVDSLVPVVFDKLDALLDKQRRLR